MTGSRARPWCQPAAPLYATGSGAGAGAALAALVTATAPSPTPAASTAAASTTATFLFRVLPPPCLVPSLGVRLRHLRQRRSHRALGLRWALASHSAAPSRARPAQKTASGAATDWGRYRLAACGTGGVTEAPPPARGARPPPSGRRSRPGDGGPPAARAPGP